MHLRWSSLLLIKNHCAQSPEKGGLSWWAVHYVESDLTRHTAAVSIGAMTVSISKATAISLASLLRSLHRRVIPGLCGGFWVQIIFRFVVNISTKIYSPTFHQLFTVGYSAMIGNTSRHLFYLPFWVKSCKKEGDCSETGGFLRTKLAKGKLIKLS